ncbi:MAG TPA: PucR family transcriptional regulator [Bacillales bacterium]
MKTAFKLTVKDILKRPNFEEAEIVAGKTGLNHVIRWVHIMEVAETGQLLSGNELILSTGVGWREDQQLSCSFLKQLIDHKVSGLCIELGTYVSSIPEEMIELAERNHFPLIVFRSEVRFIDITQDINGLLMDTHYKMMSDLESFSNQLNHLLLSTDGFNNILRLLYRYLNKQMIYVPIEGESLFFPSVEKTDHSALLSSLYSESSGNRKIRQSIQALGHKFADLFILASSEEWTDFDSLVLDRTATALAQDQLRLLYVEEKRKYRENRWVQKWLQNEHSKEEIEQYLSALEPSLKESGCVACLCKLDFSDRQVDFTYYSMIFRSIFDKQGFFPLVTLEQHFTVFALIDKRRKEDWKSRLKHALRQIQGTDLIQDQRFESFHFGAGKRFEALDRLHESYKMAKETFYIQEKTGERDSPFYEELYMYRLISMMKKQDDLQEFILDHIGMVLEFDAKHNSQMFKTLKVYLAANGSKKEAAKHLYVVRQTLYHRIEKLKELLGEDFMQPKKRLAIEFAVHAREFMM